MNWRDDRLKSVFLNEINMALSNREDIKEIAFFTVTDTELLDEGKVLNVYFSIFESDEKSKEKKINLLLEKLNSLSFEIKSIIRKRIKTKYVPNIYFKFDSTPQKAQKIEEILKKISSEKKDETSGEGNK